MASKLLLLLFASLLALPSTFAAILAIDYGTDWTKASLMKPGIPFDVLLNKDSKRKIHSSVGWNRDDRLFGSDAFNIVRMLYAPFIHTFLTMSLYRLPDSLRTHSHHSNISSAASSLAIKHGTTIKLARLFSSKRLEGQ